VHLNHLIGISSAKHHPSRILTYSVDAACLTEYAVIAEVGDSGFCLVTGLRKVVRMIWAVAVRGGCHDSEGEVALANGGCYTDLGGFGNKWKN